MYMKSRGNGIEWFRIAWVSFVQLANNYYRYEEVCCTRSKPALSSRVFGNGSQGRVVCKLKVVFDGRGSIYTR